MPMNPVGLASEIQSALEGKGAVSSENKGFAGAVIDEISQMGKVVAAPGNVTGSAPPGALAGGAEVNGLIIGVTGPSLAARIAQGLGKGPPTAQVIGTATAIATHILTAKVVFAAGQITGVDSNTPSSPGALLGQGSGGKVTGLDGDQLATLMAQMQGGPPSKKLKATAAAIVGHIQKNAEVSFAPGTVVGVAPPGGGPLSAGAGTGGTIM